MLSYSKLSKVPVNATAILIPRAKTNCLCQTLSLCPSVCPWIELDGWIEMVVWNPLAKPFHDVATALLNITYIIIYTTFHHIYCPMYYIVLCITLSYIFIYSLLVSTGFKTADSWVYCMLACVMKPFPAHPLQNQNKSDIELNTSRGLSFNAKPTCQSTSKISDR